VAKLKRHVDPRDDEVCRRFAKADELRLLTPQLQARKGTTADRNRVKFYDLFATNQSAARYLV